MPADELRAWLRSPRGATHALIIGFALLHVLFAVRLPLAGYEAHYALYGYYLDWSYVDHPPLAGWLQALVLNFASTDAALRLVPIGLSILGQYLLAGLVRRLYPQDSPWLPFLSVLLLQGTVITHLAITMSPDGPLVPLSILALWFTLRVLKQGRWRDWLGLGIILGLAGISKYTAVTLAVSVALALLLTGQARAFLRLRLWVSALLAAVIISPVLIWNFQHDWISFTYQFAYQVTKEGATSGWSLIRALKMQGWNVVAYSPLVYAGGILAAVQALRRPDQASRLLLIFALPVLLLFSWLSGFGRSAAHWTYVGWIFVTPLAARWLIEHWSQRPVRWLTHFSAAYSGLLLLFAVLLVVPAVPFPHSVRHPLALLAGWEEAAEKAEILRREMERESLPGDAPVLFVQNWHHARWLAWYERPRAVLDAGRRRSQYTLWFGEVGPESRGVLVIPSREADVPGVHAQGLRCSPVDELPVHLGPRLLHVFYFFRCGP